MKTKEEIKKRLRKLRERYARKYIESSQQRIHINCVHNHEHLPSPIPTTPVVRSQQDRKMAPSHSVSLVVIQEERPIFLCMYGSDDPSKWGGTICDNNDISRSCKTFKPILNLEQAKQEFLESMVDDEYVFNNYRDVATLQWVLGERVHNFPLTLFEQFKFWIQSKIFKTPKRSEKLLSSDSVTDLWDDSDHVKINEKNNDSD